MRIIFFSNDNFGLETLKELHTKHNLLAVITNNASKSGRGLKDTVTPIYKFAFENRIKVITPDSLIDDKFINQLKQLDAELFAHVPLCT